jgi:RND family efflux transporter MFP subunit
MKRSIVVIAVVLLAAAAVIVGRNQEPGQAAAARTEPARPALSVATVQPQAESWPRQLAANGNVVAWQEAVIGAEIGNQRIGEVLVNVGDRVRRGQLLARIAAELAQSRAAVAEAEAQLAEAEANGERARRLEASGFISGQQVRQYLSAEQAARARLEAARAKRQVDELRLAHTRVLAPDAGIISARGATVGSLAQPGQELFRLIRGGRLEWRAEVTPSELAELQPGMAAAVMAPAGQAVTGRIRMLGPTLDAATRLALVYVDLPESSIAAGLRAGMFARGLIDLGSTPARTLPQSAVVLRDGFSYVFRLDPAGKVLQTKVEVGRRRGERVEILAGLDPEVAVVAAGVGFLADGDSVRVVGTQQP